MSNTEKPGMSQKKQLIMMVVLLAVCAVLVTWTVLLLKDRIDRNQTNEQISQLDLTEVSENGDTETTAPVTGVGMWEDVLAGVTTVTSVKIRATLPATESQPPATRKFVTQPAVFIRVTTARASVTTKKHQNGAAPNSTHKQQGAASTAAGTGNRTTTTTAKPQTAPHTTMPPATTPHPQNATQPQTTPAPPVTPQAPSSAQVIYNQLLAVYLGAGAQNGKAYYYEPAGNGQPTVVVGNGDGFAGVYRTDDCVKRVPLGGTGDSSDNPWQTGTDFVFRKNTNGNNYAFYESEGANNRVVGGFNPDTGDNIWMRLHYTEENGTVKADYHLYRKNEAGVQNELASGTGTADRIYALPADIAAVAAAAGFPSGDISALPEAAANAQGDIAALRNRAGTYNDGFALQPGSLYGVIGANSDNVYLRAGMSLASNIIVSLPAGTFVSVDSNFDPENPGMWCPVSVTVNGTPYSGYVSAVYVLTWKAE
ncbi:MAG: hypothetical protein IKG82_00890 [Oscillospiraceae bacterium]|nr:hypothetical protein [Oscillospiraceae bacterium]